MSRFIQKQFILILITLIVARFTDSFTHGDIPCWDERNLTECDSPFVNPAFKLPVQVTNECGKEAKEMFCVQAESTKTIRSCGYCDANDPKLSHPASYLTDYHSHDNMTWWQSSTMVKNIQHPNSVKLTLNLGKAYVITYIRLTFYSSRPESFAIYKKNGDKTSDWIPFQYFSASCEDTYNVSSHEILTVENEDKATCIDEHSDISPLTGGTVVFSTLQGRPSALNFKESAPLKNWVTATDIMISLDRLNTFGDEVFGDKQVLSQYYYGIYDFSIGAKCMCHGHATECVNDGGTIKCSCHHNTDGIDCEKCLPFYNDRPWHRATGTNAHECRPCNCNGLSEECVFDEDLYAQTGHGGHCINCREFTAGPNCELCEFQYYRRPGENHCTYCHCDPLGSTDLQCVDGRCNCKPGVTGEKCDQCLPNYYNLTENGCSKCHCDPSGVIEGSEETCDRYTGQCYCKEYVTGQSCNQCREGYFGLFESNSQGCTSCFCYGHSLNCTLEEGQKVTSIKSSFTQDTRGWGGVDRYGDEAEVERFYSNEIALDVKELQPYFFTAPNAFLGDLHRSYGLKLSFKLRVESNGYSAHPSSEDIIIESANGGILALPINSQGNPLPNEEIQEFSYKLGEKYDLRWVTRDLPYLEFIRLLSNVSAIKIRGTYGYKVHAYLSDFSLETSTGIQDIVFDPNVELDEDPSSIALVEQCQCSEEYVGQFCEGCAPGYKRTQAFSGSWGSCALCECNGHSDICDSESGSCSCEHNTAGDNCEFCKDGYYGDATNGTESDCKECNCPNGGRCIQLVSTGDIVCLDCPDGYGGLLCDECIEDYYMDGDMCLPCNCNNNTHPNAIRVCDGDTGECLDCFYNTTGTSCENCFDGFYGDPTSDPHGQCYACECNEIGSVPEKDADGNDKELTCDLTTGQCNCKTNIEGLKCDTCVNGTWNMHSGNGCESCGCDPVGSVDQNCDLYTGRCTCKKGVGGEKCNYTLPFHYGFNITGAFECLCDPYGSESSQCDVITGQCPCKPQYRGRMCNQCQMNKFDLQRGCVDCPVCYNIVMEEAERVSKQIERMKETFDQAQNLPDNFFDENSEYNDLVRILRTELDKLEYKLKNNARIDELKWYVEAEKELERVNKAFSNLTEHTSHLPAEIANNKAEINTASDLLELFKDELGNLTKTLSQQKTELLEQIKERQIQSGQQSEELTSTAKNAREILVDLETKLEEINQRLKKAENTTVEIIKMHKELSIELQKRDEQIFALKNLEGLMLEKYTKVKEETESAMKRIVSLLDESGVLLKETKDLEVPEAEKEPFNSTVFVNILKEENKNAENQQKNLAELTAKFVELQRNLSHLLSNTYAALNDRKRLEETSKDAYNRSMKAVDKVEEVFIEANNILETFKAFDEKIETSRKKSEDAIASVGDAEESYPKDIYEKIHEAKVRMEGPSGDVHADDLEYRNQDILTQIYNRTQDLDKYEKEFDEIENSTRIIEVFVNKVDQQLDDVELELNDLEEEDKNETLAIEELQNTILQIKNFLSESGYISEQTNALADSLTHYFDHVLEPVEQEKMEKLKEEYEKINESAQKVVKHKIFETLEEDNDNEENLSKSYEEELVQFEYDVRNIEEISQLLPTKCFNPLNLEPGPE